MRWEGKEPGEGELKVFGSFTGQGEEKGKRSPPQVHALSVEEHRRAHAKSKKRERRYDRPH